MACLRKYGWPAGLAIGLLAGLIMAGLWPHTPIHATATDRKDTFALATGYVDDGVEAVYYLDFLTGALRAAVLSSRSRTFQAVYETNINVDLQQMIGAANTKRMAVRGAPGGGEIQMPATPNYIMVTGAVDIRSVAGQRRRPPSAALYVAETNTGIVLAYLIPWSPEMHSADQPQRDKLQVWAADQFSSAVLRAQ